MSWYFRLLSLNSVEPCLFLDYLLDFDLVSGIYVSVLSSKFLGKNDNGRDLDNAIRDTNRLVSSYSAIEVSKVETVAVLSI